MAEPSDVVFLFAPPWHGPTRFSKHHLAAFLAERGHRVLYVEAPLTVLGARRGRAFVHELSDALRPPRLVAPRLWRRRHVQIVPYHAVTRVTSARAANRLGQRLVAPALRRDMRRLGFARPTLVAGLPHAVDLAPLVPRQCLVYHCADEYAHVKGFPPTLPRLEAELCTRADLVVTTSRTLCEDRKRFNAATYWIPNGVDVAHFGQPVEAAAELRSLAAPVIGFVGGLSQWVDVELIGALARRRPEWTFALVGPIGVDVAGLQGLRNVWLLGPRPYALVPAYLAGMDVGLIPFRAEPVTYHADPIKVYEYLAAGLPVVATDLPALHRLADVVRLASTVDEFESEIGAALVEGRAARAAERQTEAARHSWASRFSEFERLLSEACPGFSGGS